MGAPGNMAGDVALARSETRDALKGATLMAFDAAPSAVSADLLYAAGLRMMGAHARHIAPEQLRGTFLNLRRQRQAQGGPLVALDAAAEESLAQRYPGIEKIRVEPAPAWERNGT